MSTIEGLLKLDYNHMTAYVSCSRVIFNILKIHNKNTLQKSLKPVIPCYLKKYIGD